MKIKYKTVQCSIVMACAVMLLSLALPTTVFAQTAAEVRQLKQTVEQLKQQLQVMQEKLEAVTEDINANAEAVEATAKAVEESVSEPTVFDNLSIGGYGEVHYNNLDADNSEYDKDQIDIHRFVLFLGYDYSDKLRFVSEFEIEHGVAGEGQEGEVEIEQAYVEYDFTNRTQARAGVFLLPIGLLNETHEPPTFYGVERNTIENVIIPATWWASGIGMTHRTEGGLSFDLALHEGLKIDPKEGTEARVRSGRQKSANAKADDFALTGRLKYTGIQGLELATSLQFQQDPTQESDEIDDGVLWEAHVAYNRGPFALRALYAQWDFDADSGTDIKKNDLDEQEGWYIEPSWKPTESFGLFARYEEVEGGRSRDEFDQWVIGFNYWVSDDVVLKADYQDRQHDNDADEGRDFDGFNLGVGYQF